MVRIILALVIAAHGIGHLLFLVPLLGIADWGQSTRSWLLGAESGARIVGSVLWVVAMIGFGAAVYGLWNQQVWWRNVLIIASVISTATLIIFWVNPVSSPALSALVFNLLVLGLLLIVRWSPIETIGI